MKKVLVVEDSQTDLEILSSTLGKQGYEVVKATNHSDALSLLKQQAFNVIIADVILPDRSGFELCRAIKAEESTRQVPVIICSTKKTDIDKFWGMKQGADAYLTKPIDTDELTQTLQKVINQS